MPVNAKEESLAGFDPNFYTSQVKHLLMPPDILPTSILTVFTLLFYG